MLPSPRRTETDNEISGQVREHDYMLTWEVACRNSQDTFWAQKQ